LPASYLAIQTALRIAKRITKNPRRWRVEGQYPVAAARPTQLWQPALGHGISLAALAVAFTLVWRVLTSLVAVLAICHNPGSYIKCERLLFTVAIFAAFRGNFVSNTLLDTSGSLGRLYRDHHGWLKGWLRGRLGNVMDAEDLAQDTFVRVIRSPQPAEYLREPRRFLVTIAKGLTVDLFRRRSLERQYLEALAELPEPHWPSEEERAVTLETLVELDAMLAGLGSRLREAFFLSLLEGRTYAQIASLLGVSLRTVKNDMAKTMEHCALYRLEQQLL